MITILILVAALLMVMWILRSTLRWIRYDQAAKIVEYWRRNGVS